MNSAFNKVYGSDSASTGEGTIVGSALLVLCMPALAQNSSVLYLTLMNHLEGVWGS